MIIISINTHHEYGPAPIANLPNPGKVDRESRCGSFRATKRTFAGPPTLEGFLLSGSLISPELIEAYRQTHYRVGTGDGAFILHVDQRSGRLAEMLSQGEHCSAAFVTAFNPFSLPRSSENNLFANALLLDDLIEAGFSPVEAAGIDPTGIWPDEASFFVLGISLETAMALGREYDQNGLLWAGEDAVPRLILLR